VSSRHPARRAAATRPLAAFCLAVIVGAAAAADEPSLAELEVAAWSALINHGLEADTAMVVVAEQTTGDPAGIARDRAAAATIASQLEVPPAALADWARRNAGTDLIEGALDLRVSYQVLNEKTRAELFAAPELTAAWRAFFERYAGAPGVLRLSHAGFDETRAHALVYLEHHCGAECGAGHLFHLVRGGAGEWTVAGGAVVWMVE
jgi:hypothetical protein